MKKRLLVSLLLLQLAAIGGALAHGGGWRDLPPEDRRRMREEMRDQHGWRNRYDDRGGSRD